MSNPIYIYCRHIDDIFVDIQDEQRLTALKSNMGARFCSSLRTLLTSIDHRMSFLDVDIDASDGLYILLFSWDGCMVVEMIIKTPAILPV